MANSLLLFPVRGRVYVSYPGRSCDYFDQWVTLCLFLDPDLPDWQLSLPVSWNTYSWNPAAIL